jgi:uncharacterized protein (DUF58 family)
LAGTGRQIGRRVIERWTAPLVVGRLARPGCLITIELRQRLPVLVWLAALVAWAAWPTPVAAVGMAALSGWLLAAWLWARSLARGLTAQRDLHYTAVQVGDELEEHFTVDNASWLPVLWAEVVDQSDLPGYAASSVRAVGGLASLRWRVHGLCRRRGLFVLGPWELRTGDPFGLFLVRQVYTQRRELLVYPPLASLPQRLRPHTRYVGEQRRLRQLLPAESLNALKTRPYSPGDPLRHVHWPTTARHGQLYVRVFEPEATSTVWLVPDLDASVHLALTGTCEAGHDLVHAAPHDQSTEELMVLLAASLADALLRCHLAVGLLAHTGPGRVAAVRPARGRAQLWPLLRALAPLRAAGDLPLAEVLTHLEPLFSSRDRLIVITPSFEGEWPRGLRRTAGRGGLECMLIDRASFGGQGRAEACLWSLAEQGVAGQVVRRGELEPAGPAYSALRRWEFMTLATGRAVPRQTPRPSTQRVEVGYVA